MRAQQLLEQNDRELRTLNSESLSWFEAAYAARSALADPTGATPVDMATVRERYAGFQSGIEDTLVEHWDELIGQTSDTERSSSRFAQIVLVVGIVGFVIGIGVVQGTYRTSAAQDRELEERDAARAVHLRRSEIESRIGRALEYARTERDACRVVEEAMEQLHPDRPTELLLADSSRAHFAVASCSSRDDGWSGCEVPTPGECPAVAAGLTLVFDTSEKFDSCPYLKERPGGPLSATCVPVSINGVAQAVLHSTGPNGTPVDAEARWFLELLASRAGDRIGVLRAFSQTESQAATDPLTGLDNRRSFESKVAKLVDEGRDFVVAFGDLDHFKRLNDAHGHDTGDRALRAFAHTFRNAVRPGDIVARWGGEEFVVAFPDATDDVAAMVLERVRGELAAVVARGSVPPFTVSFGVSEGSEPDLVSQIASADRALLAAKQAGRDRVVRARDLGSELVTDADAAGASTDRG